MSDPRLRDIDSFDFKKSRVNGTRLRQQYAGDYLTTARNIGDAFYRHIARHRICRFRRRLQREAIGYKILRGPI
jgi:hypothetical protein